MTMADAVAISCTLPNPVDIRTKSIELTLLPLVNQINTLVNCKRDLPLDRKRRQLEIACLNVTGAVEQFTVIGLRIASSDNAPPHSAMVDACRDARDASSAVSSLCLQETNKASSDKVREQLVRHSRQLLSAISRILIFADKIVVQEIISTKRKVATSLDRVTQIASFSEFVPGFSLFGEEMVEFGRLTGDRQNDLKKDTDAAKMACIRGFIEKSTAILLVSCKACLRHHAVASAEALETREKARCLMHGLLNDVEALVSYSTSSPRADHRNDNFKDKVTLRTCFRSIVDALEIGRVLHSTSAADSVAKAYQALEDTVQEFTDSAYIPHEHREKILQHCTNCSRLVNVLSNVASTLVPGDCYAEAEYERLVEETSVTIQELYKQLVETAGAHAAAAADRGPDDAALLNTVLSAAQAGDEEYADSLAARLADRNEQIAEACRLLKHVAVAESHGVKAECIGDYLSSLSDILKLAIRVLSQNATSRTAEENFETVRSTWTAVVHELSVLARDVCGDASLAAAH